MKWDYLNLKSFVEALSMTWWLSFHASCKLITNFDIFRIKKFIGIFQSLKLLAAEH